MAELLFFRTESADSWFFHQRGSLAWATGAYQADLVKKVGGTEHMQGR
jgi:hypothetical protein